MSGRSKEAPPERCPGCKKKKIVIWGADPYRAELMNDKTPVWLCQDCRWLHAEEV